MALFSELLGKTLIEIDVSRGDGDDIITFFCSDGDKFTMYHQQDCCECVDIKDIVGDVEDLINSPILRAEERTEINEYGDYESSTATFYELATIKGSVTISWLGTSNGYYSESVDFKKNSTLL